MLRLFGTQRDITGLHGVVEFGESHMTQHNIVTDILTSPNISYLFLGEFRKYFYVLTYFDHCTKEQENGGL